MTNKTNQYALGLENLFKKPDFSIKSYLLIRKKSQKHSGSPDIPKIKQPKHNFRKGSLSPEKKKNKYLELLKSLKVQNEYQVIPSIPGEKHKLGYYETPDKKLFLPKFEKKEVSPVSYQNMSGFEIQNHNIVAFKSNKKRFSGSKSPTNEKVGPGSYNNDLTFYKPKSSKYIKRKIFMPNTQKLNNTPGPGAYLKENNTTSFPKKASPKKFQFFMSGVEKTIKEGKKEKNIPAEMGLTFFNYKEQAKKNFKKRIIF